MRKEGVRLLALARQGDIAARCEVGRCYLQGLLGFPQHPATGVEYLQHESLANHPAAARIVAEGLSLVDLLKLDLLEPLTRAAAGGSVVAQVKLGAWRVLRNDRADAIRLLSSAASAAHPGAQSACAALRDTDPADTVLTVLRQLDASGDVCGHAVARIGAQHALAQRQLGLLVECIRAALALSDGLDAELVTLVANSAQLAESLGQVLTGLPSAAIRESLERRSTQGDRASMFMFGSGLCGIACPALLPEVFGDHMNMRKGAAFLLRAADGGCDAAWLHLYRLHADHRLSVANPQLARFFLEKGALRGQTEAQRKLGALLLREATALADTEQAIHWLYQASEKGDVLADALLSSLVLPVGNHENEAATAIEQVRRVDPWLAERLALARAFGLTKLEALCVDPVDGVRPWGLVVGKNPFISQVRLSAPRAIPAVTEGAIDVVQRAASFFGQSRSNSGAAEGDLRARSLRQRRIFERLNLVEVWFFSDATSMTLESLRQGAKWAYRARQPLREALAA